MFNVQLEDGFPRVYEVRDLDEIQDLITKEKVVIVGSMGRGKNGFHQLLASKVIDEERSDLSND